MLVPDEMEVLDTLCADAMAATTGDDPTETETFPAIVIAKVSVAGVARAACLQQEAHHPLQLGKLVVPRPLLTRHGALPEEPVAI